MVYDCACKISKKIIVIASNSVGVECSYMNERYIFYFIPVNVLVEVSCRVGPTDMNDSNGFLVESVGVVFEAVGMVVVVMLVVVRPGKKAALSCARSHFCAIRWAASSALSTSAREGDDCGVCARRSERTRFFPPFGQY